MQPETDPFNRQIVIAMGCFLKLYRMAAGNLGCTAQIDSFPDGEPEPVLNGKRIARVTLQKDNTIKDPLFDAVILAAQRKNRLISTNLFRPIYYHN